MATSSSESLSYLSNIENDLPTLLNCLSVHHGLEACNSKSTAQDFWFSVDYVFYTSQRITVNFSF